MIDGIKLNKKVGGIKITLNKENSISNELIQQINKKYKNLYWIWIGDCLDNIDNEIHTQFKKIVKQKILFKFTLAFNYRNLFNSPDGFALIKEYNLIMKE